MMAAFLRRYQRKLKACLLLCLVSFLAVSLLLTVVVQESTDRSQYWRIAFGRTEGQSNCPLLFDDVDVELVKILERLKPIETVGGDGDADAKQLEAALETLTRNKLMAEDRYARRAFYLADVLKTYKDRLLMQEKERRRRVEEDAVKRKIEHLVRIVENMTDAKTESRNEKPAKSSQPIRIYRTNVSNPKTWQLFHSEISQHSLYSGNDRLLVDRLLQEMSSLPVKSLRPLTDQGTQLKLVFELEDGSRVLFKPRRLPRDYVESLDVYYMYEFEKHTAEIAVFHLDRILGFNRVPPVAGRYIDMLKDVKDKAKDDLFKDTFYKSPVGNQCFFGICDYFCEPAHGICGNGTTLEGSTASYLPPQRIAPRTRLSNPWSRSYSRHREADWETVSAAVGGGAGYCRSVRQKEPWRDDRAILNLVDAHVFDFFTGNKDRHHFAVFSKYGNASYPILYDNGKGFGRALDDITSILAPLRQCCVIRRSTLNRLIELATGDERLSELTRRSLSQDVLPDILSDAHLRSLDRRLSIVLDHVHECILGSTPEQVVLDRS